MKKQLINLEPVKAEIRTKLLEKYDATTFMNTDTVQVQVDVKDLLEQYIASKNLTEPSVYISAEAYIKMRKLVDDTSTEIGWYGIVTQVPALTNVYVIEDIIVYPQKVTGATCEQDDDKMFEFEMSLTDEQVNHKRFHGHSHVNMSTGPSGVDENFYQDLLSQTKDYFIITVTNKRNEYTTRFYDIANNVLYTDVPIVPILDNGITLEAWYVAAKAKLNEPKPVETKPTTSYTGSKFQGSIFDDDNYYKKDTPLDHTYHPISDDWWDEEVYVPGIGMMTRWEADMLDQGLDLDDIKDIETQAKPKGKPGRPRKDKKGKR